MILAFVMMSGIQADHWGFYAHREINRLAVFTLPPPMIAFYKKNISAIMDMSVDPDRRRYAVPEEGARHFIDLDHYPDSVRQGLPARWDEAVKALGEDSLNAHGILPWHIARMFYLLKNAFMVKDTEKILRLSSEMGHYIGDAHVPLHTTENYDGQKTRQQGIHAFWESRLPELFATDYDYFVGKANYLSHPSLSVWKAILSSHQGVDSVLLIEKKISYRMGDQKYSFETRGRVTQKVVSREYSLEYHVRLQGMVEERMRRAIKMVGDIWFTAWVDAGMPNLNDLMDYSPTEKELEERKKLLRQWKENGRIGREHETGG